MRNRLFPVIAFAGALALALSACKKEDEKADPLPEPQNSLAIDGTAFEIKNFVSCSQGVFFRLMGTVVSGAGNGTMVIDFGGSALPAAGTYPVVSGNPGTYQASVLISPDPQTNYQATHGLLSVSVVNESIRAVFSGLTLSRPGSSETYTASGSLACFGAISGSGSGFTTANLPASVSIQHNQQPSVSMLCQRIDSLNQFQLAASYNNNAGIVTLAFSPGDTPQAGVYEVVAQNPQAGQASIALQPDAQVSSTSASGGVVTVAVVEGKPKARFRNIIVSRTDGSGNTILSADMGCP